MRDFISADMEGISGVSNWEEMKRYRDELNALMTGDLNAVIEGILEATPGATEIVVADSHSDALNVVYRDLHPRASLLRGHPRPRYMMAGLEAGFDRA
jgi:D-amino peptidase